MAHRKTRKRTATAKPILSKVDSIFAVNLAVMVDIWFSHPTLAVSAIGFWIVARAAFRISKTRRFK